MAAPRPASRRAAAAAAGAAARRAGLQGPSPGKRRRPTLGSCWWCTVGAARTGSSTSSIDRATATVAELLGCSASRVRSSSSTASVVHAELSLVETPLVQGSVVAAPASGLSPAGPGPGPGRRGPGAGGAGERTGGGNRRPVTRPVTTVVSVAGMGAGRRLPLGAGTWLVGRHPGADWSSTAPRCAPATPGCASTADGAVEVRDLGSHNGTWLGARGRGRRVDARARRGAAPPGGGRRPLRTAAAGRPGRRPRPRPPRRRGRPGHAGPATPTLRRPPPVNRCGFPNHHGWIATTPAWCSSRPCSRRWAGWPRWRSPGTGSSPSCPCSVRSSPWPAGGRGAVGRAGPAAGRKPASATS